MTEEQNKDPKIAAIKEAYEKQKAENQQDNNSANPAFSEDIPEQIPDIKPLIAEDNEDYKKLVEHKNVENMYRNAIETIAPFCGWGWCIPFTKASAGFKDKGKTEKKICFFEIEEFIDRLNKIPEAAYKYESIIKTLINKIGKPTNFFKGKVNTKSHIPLPHYSLPDLNKQLDIYFKEIGIKVDEVADENLSYEKRVKVEAFKCMEKGRKMTTEKGFYPIRSSDPNDANAQFYTSGDVFKKPTFPYKWEAAPLKEMHKEWAIPEKISDVFCETLTEDFVKDCKKFVAEHKGKSNAELEMGISEEAINLELELQKDLGQGLANVTAAKLKSDLISSTEYCLKMLLVMDSGNQKRWIRNIAFSHFPITKDDDLRFIIRVFFQLRDMGDGYCGIERFNDDEEFLEAANRLTDGYIIKGSRFKEKNLAMFEITQLESLRNKIVKHASAIAKNDKTISKYNLEKLRRHLAITNLATNYFNASNCINKGDTKAARNAHFAAPLIDITTGKDTIGSVHSFPLASSLKGLSDVEIQDMCDSTVADDVIETPFFELNKQLRAPGQTKGGVQRGDVLTIPSTSGGGKSFLAAEFGIYAFRYGRNVLVLTLENRRETFLDRLAQRFNPYGEYDPEVLDDPNEEFGVVTTTNGNIYVAECINKMSPEDIQARKIATRVAMIHAMSAYHSDNPGHLLLDPLDNMFTNANMIKERIEAYQTKYNRNLDLLVIDSALQLTSNAVNSNRQNHEIKSEAIEEIAFLASSQRVAVVMTHQMNATGNKNAANNKVSSVTDMGTTLNVLMKSSTVVINNATDAQIDNDCASLEVAKSRHGRKGAVIFYMRDLPYGVGFLPYTDRYVGNGDKDEKLMKISRRKFRGSISDE